MDSAVSRRTEIGSPVSRPNISPPVLAVSPPVLAGLLVFLMAFGLFAATTSHLTGYEPETAAVTEGLVKTGAPREIQGSPLQFEGQLGRGGHLYGRTGLLQPVLEAPFYAAGWGVDELTNGGHGFNHRSFALMLYNPFVAALAAVSLFAFVFLVRGSLPWASAIATLFVVASIAWPYAKIGMETTMMFTLITAFALGAYARLSTRPAIWGLTGFTVGAATATKGYGAVGLVAIGVLLWPTFRDLQRPRQVRLALAFLLPVIAWLLVDAGYNWWRFGLLLGHGPSGSAGAVASAGIVALALLALYARRRRKRLFWALVGFGVLVTAAPLIAASVGITGLLVSTGKGLIFYSPLVVIGALGLPRMWRQDRWLTASLTVLFVAFLALAGSRPFWGDETWGPRYLVPVAWVLLVPLAWWVTTKARRTLLIGVAVLGVAIQLVAVSVNYAHYIDILDHLTGVNVYDVNRANSQRIPYGDDPPRWIPQLSPLLLQAEGILSSQVIKPLFGQGLTVSYAPFEGRVRTIDLSSLAVNSQPDFWWYSPFNSLRSRLIAASLLILSMWSLVGLYRVSLRPTRAPPIASLA